MADGVEVRGNRVRMYFRYQGELCREPFPGDATPENIAQAERLVGMINYEIKAGTFSYARHFPDSPKIKTNTLGHYIDLWLDIKHNEMAPSGFRTYKSKIETHIRPRWGNSQADLIDHLDLQTWVQQTLMPNLHNKTVREIISILRQVFVIYRTRNRTAHDPSEGIVVRLPDPDEADPFDRDEIAKILSGDETKQQEMNLAKFMIWAGPRVSEAMALEALQAQASFTAKRDPVQIEVTDRDNKTVKRQTVRFVFHKSTTDEAWTSSDVLIKTWWSKHLEEVGVRYRGPNNCRHTYASQMLSTGVVPLDWIADQMGHTSTAMIWRHYGKWINKDGPDMIGLLERALQL